MIRTEGFATELPLVLYRFYKLTCLDVITNICFMIETRKRFKTTLFIRTRHNTRIFGAVPFIKLQNDT